ncbi:uncharacterized protein M421DRAFT_322168 [Didymella exigua CBS 183.55]|uniref:F-box domain-containing protein n=1 Tax=Didymella exigua CBS 183.55 TaxID=1150837 RepID=A0A6A5RWC4_9PLEO|nr:uncharacterized protein M421DRAFT_322168 [Didymella exigua CBS 183.55]KAF1931859.1 hypothetical protein M421DRAFT_322168 [Didymella exigua CBS 183.55]
MIEPPNPTQDAVKTVKITPARPAEIWLQTLEYVDHQHLWLSVRNVCRTHKDCVERLFTSKHLANLSIALSLPRRDPATVVKDRYTQKFMEELKVNGTLPKERLGEAPAYLNMSTYSFTGIKIHIPVRVDWDEARKIWTWDVEWRNVLGDFYDAKEKRKAR